MKYRLFLSLILLLALGLRLFKVNLFPATLYGDEQAFAWNAYSILKTGQDEYGISYPLQFRSFDDYKAPIPVYILVPFLKTLGLNILAIRLPVVIFSVLTVCVIFLLSRQFFNRKISLLAAFLLAISPWHIHLSRGYFESTISLFFFVTAVWLFVGSRLSLKQLIISMSLFSLSLYSYFTPRILLLIFIPFLLVYGFIYFRGKEMDGNFLSYKKIITRYFLSLLFLFVITLPLVNATLFDKGFSRFSKLTESMNENISKTVNKERNTSLLPDPWRNILHNKVIVWVKMVKDNYFEHLSINFWYLYGDNSLRYFLGNMGMFYLTELPFMAVGGWFLYKENKRAFFLFSSWILLSPIPASIVGRPFAVRSMAMLPAPFIFVSYGIYKMTAYTKIISLKKIIKSGICILFTFSLGIVLVRYYFEYPRYAATWWGWENKAALDYAKIKETEYDNIFISDFYTGSVLAFAVYNSYDPVKYREGIRNPVILADNRRFIKMGKYYFGSLDISTKDRLSIIPPKSLYIGRPEEIDLETTINAPDDGRILFKIYRSK